MKQLKWNDIYTSGDLTVDTQHMVLFEILNKIQIAISSENGKIESAGLVDFLQRYAIEHFECEERLMTAKKYPGLSQHPAAHEDIAGLVRKIVEKFKSDPATFTLEPCAAVAQLLENHISEEDLKMVKFLRGG